LILSVRLKGSLAIDSTGVRPKAERATAALTETNKRLAAIKRLSTNTPMVFNNKDNAISCLLPERSLRAQKYQSPVPVHTPGAQGSAPTNVAFIQIVPLSVLVTM